MNDTRHCLKKKKQKGQNARNLYQNMSEKGKHKRKEYGKQYRKNMSEEDKKKKKEGVHERIQKTNPAIC